MSDARRRTRPAPEPPPQAPGPVTRQTHRAMMPCWEHDTMTRWPSRRTAPERPRRYPIDRETDHSLGRSLRVKQPQGRWPPSPGHLHPGRPSARRIRPSTPPHDRRRTNGRAWVGNLKPEAPPHDEELKMAARGARHSDVDSRGLCYLVQTSSHFSWFLGATSRSPAHYHPALVSSCQLAAPITHLPRQRIGNPSPTRARNPWRAGGVLLHTEHDLALG